MKICATDAAAARGQAGHSISRIAAFSLIEVLLAIGIAVGLLVVALFFYHQAANFRSQLLQESDRLSAMRLVMDRITTDLRGSFAQPQEGFTGTAESMRFVKADMPWRASWTAGPLGRAASAETDQKLVSYWLTLSPDNTNTVVAGLARSEEPLVEKRPVAGATSVMRATVEPASTNQLSVEPLTDAIRFVRFRYWDGLNWTESWNASDLPLGVEVTLGSEPLAEDELPGSQPREIFRRVISLPEARQGSGELNPSAFGAANTPAVTPTAP